MSNFLLLQEGVFVDGALEEIKKNALWNWVNLRRSFQNSCHLQIEDVVFRGPRVDIPQTFETFMNGLESVSYWTWFLHAEVVALVKKVFESNYEKIGRVVCTKIPPGGKVDLHPDQGAYAEAHDRFHVVLETEKDGCEFWCGGEMVLMQKGQFWKFNHELPHEVFNRSKSDRINLIVDVRR